MSVITYDHRWLTNIRDRTDWLYEDGAYLVRGTIRKEHSMMYLNIYAVKRNGRLQRLARCVDYVDMLVYEDRVSQYPRLQMLLDLLRAAYPQHTFIPESAALK